MERRFLLIAVCVTLVLACSVLSLNYYIDPFNRHASSDDGFDRRPAAILNRRIYRVVEFDRWIDEHPGVTPSVIVGDSTGAQIDDRLMSEATGEPWLNMSIGGGGLPEMAAIAEHLMQKSDLRRIVWFVPFTRMVLDDQNDVPRALEMAAAPLKHMLTYEATKASLLVLRATWFGVGFEDPTLDIGDTDPVSYQLSRIRTEMAGRAWPEAAMEEIRDLAEKAAARGIPVTFVNPPLHPRTLAMMDEAFSDRLKRYQAFFAGDCFIDFSTQVMEGRWTPNMYSDAVHLEREYKPALARALAEAVSEDSACRATTGVSAINTAPSKAVQR